MNLNEAQALAESLRALMAPYCERVEIAGSIRRRRPEVKDLEIVAIPQWVGEADPADLFAEATRRRNRLHDWATDPACPVRWRKPGTLLPTPWTPSADGRYWRGETAGGAALDLFLTTPEQWGLIYLIRTGSAEFSRAVVTHALKVGCRSQDGHLVSLRDHHRIPTPTEESVFEALRLEWVPPEDRTGPEALRVRRRE